MDAKLPCRGTLVAHRLPPCLPNGTAGTDSSRQLSRVNGMPSSKAGVSGITCLVSLCFSAKTVLPLISKKAMHSWKFCCLPNGDTPWLVCGGVSSVPLDHLPAVLEGTSDEGGH
jgi:hypothetical protein